MHNVYVLSNTVVHAYPFTDTHGCAFPTNNSAIKLLLSSLSLLSRVVSRLHLIILKLICYHLLYYEQLRATLSLISKNTQNLPRECAANVPLIFDAKRPVFRFAAPIAIICELSANFHARQLFVMDHISSGILPLLTISSIHRFCKFSRCV